MATMKIVGSGAVIPSSSTAYIGDFLSGGIAECQFKIAASDDATNQTYPIGIYVTYTDSEGTELTSAPEIVGIPVNAKTSFTVTSPVPAITAGSQSTITVQYRNNGNSTVYATQSRLTPHGLITINDVAYLGDIRPGEIATAQYNVVADKDAEPGDYTFDSKLRFRDALGNSQESHTIAVDIQVLPASSGLSFSTVVAGIILVVIAAVIVLLAYQRRKKAQ